VSTAKAVAGALRQSGKDTTEADLLIYQAENAYDRREYINCMDLASRAKDCLRSAKEKDLASCPVPPPSEKKAEGKAEKGQEVPAHATKKMPTNYLESKFIIETVECRLPSAGDKHPEVEKMLGEAKASFEATDYTMALKQAMKAKRLLENAPMAEAPAPQPVEVIKPLRVPAPKKEVERCAKCGSEMGKDDSFCPACGTKKGARTCPSCSVEALPDDAFCRKCGAKLA